MSKPIGKPPEFRNPDGELALAFFGSIAVGALSAAAPLLLFGPSGLWGLFAMVGGGIGCFWGYLTVIVAAASRVNRRRISTVGMFGLLATGLLAIGALMRNGMADV